MRPPHDPGSAPVDPDVDLSVPADRAEWRPGYRWPVLAAVAAGGAVGAVTRFAITESMRVAPDHVNWGLLLVNMSGSLLIGVLMVLVADVFPGRRLLRPFVGVGILGGYTTFSAAMLDVERAVAVGAVGTALMVMLATVVLSLAAVWCGTLVTRWVVAASRAERTR